MIEYRTLYVAPLRPVGTLSILTSLSIEVGSCRLYFRFNFVVAGLYLIDFDQFTPRLRVVLTQSADQMSTGTCSYVASLAALIRSLAGEFAVFTTNC